MEFWVDMGFAVLLRLLKDRREAPKWTSAFRKLYNAIGRSMNPNHSEWESAVKTEAS